MANTKITSRVLADNAVLTANITDANVTTAKIAADAITGAKIADDVALGGNPTTTTQSAGNNTTRVATTAFVSTAVSNLVDSSPSALNTLNELAAALGDDANFSTTVTNSIAAKLPLAGGTMTGALDLDGQELKLDADADTSITADTDDVVDFKVGGTDRLRLAGNNLFLNGGTDARIQLGSGGAGANQVDNNTVHIRGDGVDAKYMAASGGDHIFESNGGHLVTMKDDGKVGINDTTPDALFTVKGSADSYAGGLRLEGFNETTALGIAHVDGKTFFSGNATNDHITLTGDGKVGIRNTSPDAVLRINSTGGGTELAFKVSDASGNSVFEVQGGGTAVFQYGHVGIANTSPSSYDSNARNLVVGSGVGDEGMTIASGSGSGGRIFFADGTGSDAEKADGYIFYNHASQYMAFGTAGGNERMRIGSIGQVAIGTTSTGNRALSILQLVSGESGLYVNNSGGTITSSTASLAQLQFSGDADVGDGSKFMEFQRQSDTIGSITALGAQVRYNQSSDRNLKENIADASSQLNIIKNLQVREFDWKTNGKHDVGLIAQELHEHIPNIVTVGSDKKDVRGFTTPWSIDYGLLTPYLIKAIQEQQTIIEDLKARIKTLEDA